MDNDKETKGLHKELAQVSTVATENYDKIQEVCNKPMVNTFTRDFTNLQKKNLFKSRLIAGLMNNVSDTRGLIMEYEQRQKDELLNKQMRKRLASVASNR